MDAAHPVALPPSLHDRIGQLILTGFRGLTPLEAEAVFRQVREGSIGGVLLYDREEITGVARNIQTPDQTRALSDALHAAARIPLLVCADEEGGFYHRLRQQYGFPPMRSARELGLQNDLAATYEAGAVIAGALADAGIDMNFAPVVDLHVPTNLGVGFHGRAFSDDPSVVVAHAREFVAAHHAEGVLSTIKHFPGSGTTVFDPATITETASNWSPVELEPFRALAASPDVDAVMVSRARVPALDPNLPAMLSPRIINGALRNDLGFGGVAISDAMELSSIWEIYGFDRAMVLALNAGIDMLLFCNVPLGDVPYDDSRAERAVESIAAAVDRGEIPEGRIDEACARVLRLKARMRTSMRTATGS